MNSPKDGKEPIHAGDMILIKVQSSAEDGNWVLALIDDQATIKEYKEKRNHILLVPHSNNDDHIPMIMDRDFVVQGIVQKVFCDLS